MSTTRPFIRNKKIYIPSGQTSINMLQEGASFLKLNSRVPLKVLDKDHKMGIMCKQDGQSGHLWFSENYPVTQLMVIS
ncbi:MAG: hypothetical protein CMJ19_02735 [Phycisphaeraceae bacterium]|nr:hypothetical protein [Phycisphaeraceae bacterium]